MDREISFQGWFCILKMGLGVVESDEAVKLRVDVGVDEHVEVAVEHIAGEHVGLGVGVEIVGVKDRAGKVVEIGVVCLAPELLEEDVEDAFEETFEVLLDANVEVLRQEVVGKVFEAESDVSGDIFVTLMAKLVK